jgi:hypothetical protein
MSRTHLVAAHGGDFLYDKIPKNADGITQEQWCEYMKVCLSVTCYLASVLRVALGLCTYTVD